MERRSACRPHGRRQGKSVVKVTKMKARVGPIRPTRRRFGAVLLRNKGGAENLQSACGIGNHRVHLLSQWG